MNLLGGETPRPAAPWGYTNTWGNNVCLLVGWFAGRRLVRSPEPPHQGCSPLRDAGHRDRADRLLAQPRAVDRARRDGRLRGGAAGGPGPVRPRWPRRGRRRGRRGRRRCHPARRRGHRPAGQRQVQRRPHVPHDKARRTGSAESPADRLRLDPQHHRRPQLDRGRRERRLRALRQLHHRRQRPAVAAPLRARPARHRHATWASSSYGLWRFRRDATRRRMAASAAIVSTLLRDVLVQRAGHPAGADASSRMPLLWRNRLESR